MKRFFGKVARFFWSWGFLKFVLIVISLIVFLYVEEDWRGARTWAATKAKWEAKGETFDLQHFTPPLIPDDQNLAAISLFKIDQIEYAPGKFDPQLTTFRKAMRDQEDIPSPFHWQLGELPDLGRLRVDIATQFAADFPGVTPPPDTLDQFNTLYPFLADLRAAAVDRPLYRPFEDYSISPPASRALGNIVSNLKLSKLLTLHAILALNDHRSDLALQDLKLNFQVAAGTKRDPTLVAGLVGIGMGAVASGALFDGLAQHLWSDAQLAEIEHILKPINFLADYQFDFRGGAAESVTNIEYFKSAHGNRFDWALRLQGEDDESALWAPFVWPGGWWDNNKSLMADFFLSQLPSVDPASRRAFPQVVSDLHGHVKKQRAQMSPVAPWDNWFYVASGPWETVAIKFARTQVWVDQTRIACALERYRLANGVYPASLDLLAPTYIDSVPHDIMNGEPYHYVVHPNGTFLLYSVGWDQTDDGGKTVLVKDAPTSLNNVDGDWVWPTPKY